jgi:hypothetical protein
MFKNFKFFKIKKYLEIFLITIRFQKALYLSFFFLKIFFFSNNYKIYFYFKFQTKPKISNHQDFCSNKNKYSIQRVEYKDPRKKIKK